MLMAEMAGVETVTSAGKSHVGPEIRTPRHCDTEDIAFNHIIGSLLLRSLKTSRCGLGMVLLSILLALVRLKQEDCA